MKRILSTFSACLLLTQSVYAYPIQKARQRCVEDTHAKPEAEGRIRWYAKCFYEDVKNYSWGTNEQEIRDNWISNKLYINGEAAKGYLPKVYFPIFVTADYEHTWKAPVDPAAACDVPAGYAALIDCEDGCYTSGMRLAYVDDHIPILEASLDPSRMKNLLVVSESNSTLDDIRYVASDVARFTADYKKVKQSIVVLTMESERQLEVTLNHPVMVSSGELVEAGTLKVGNALVNYTGGFDRIVNIEKKEIYDKVYNVYPKQSSRLGNLVVAEGFVNGSAWYQNDAHDLLNKKLMRQNMPMEFLK